jgi:hypothetical protein
MYWIQILQRIVSRKETGNTGHRVSFLPACGAGVRVKHFQKTGGVRRIIGYPIETNNMKPPLLYREEKKSCLKLPNAFDRSISDGWGEAAGLLKQFQSLTHTAPNL